MQLKFRFFKGIIEYNISKKTRFCCVYEKTCYGPIAKMLFLNMLYNHGKLCACIIKCTIALSFYTNRLDYRSCGNLQYITTQLQSTFDFYIFSLHYESSKEHQYQKDHSANKSPKSDKQYTWLFCKSQDQNKTSLHVVLKVIKRK